jgi:hypothetical protein
VPVDVDEDVGVLEGVLWRGVTEKSALVWVADFRSSDERNAGRAGCRAFSPGLGQASSCM